MIPILRMTAACAAAALAGGMLAGCGASTSSGTGGDGSTAAMPSCLAAGEPVAVAVGARSNNPAPTLAGTVTAAMNSAIGQHQLVTIVRLDGDPQVVYSQQFSPQNAGNTQSRKSALSTYVSSLSQALDGTSQPTTDIRAQAPQADVLDALTVAASKVPPGGNVIVMDSGLQTTVPLDFRTGLLNDDPQTVVDYLRKSGELPDLSRRHVYFVGLGWTAPPQPELDISDRSRVTAIWTQIAKAAGATCVTADGSAPDNHDAVANRPPVAIVTPPPAPLAPGSCSVTDLGDADNVGFDLDSTTLRDPAGAKATLGKLAKVMLRTAESVTLTGATSSEGSDQHNLVLSQQRAVAVKTALVSLGVSAVRITTTGVGSHLPGRLTDRGPDGRLLIGPAIQNRKVVARLTGPRCSTG
jgi:OOP family OmpA-OmpF porin